MSAGPPPKKPGAKQAAPAPPPPPPPPPKAADQLDKGPQRATMDKMGSKAGPAPGTAPAVEKSYEVRAPQNLDPNHGVKDAERLKIVASATQQQAERQWLEKLQAKLQIGAPIAAKKLGFGLWKKKYDTKAALAAALDQTIGQCLAKIWAVEAPAFAPTDNEAIFVCALHEVTGEPPLHPSYADDTLAYALNIHQDDLRHVAHSYVMAFCHWYFRALIALKRQNGPEAATQMSGLSREQLYGLEVNFCQYYVPSRLPAYFEGQPLRAFPREIANRFRKVAFGGQ
jgi:hypothetical protein